MKISNKLRKQILNGMSDAVRAMLDEHCPSHKDGPPDTWPDDEKKLWDVINEVEMRAARKIDAILCAS